MPQNTDPLQEEIKNPEEISQEGLSQAELQEDSFEMLLEKAEIIPEIQQNIS